jgi:hypothetical protein
MEYIGLIWLGRGIIVVPFCTLLRSFSLQKSARYNAVGIATRYGLDGPGIESRRGPDLTHPSRPALGPTQPPIQGVPVHSRG